MLKPINNVANRVADGRRIASRSVVITSLSAISCAGFRRKVLNAVDGESREDTILNGGIFLSNIDEHAIEYEDLGFAMFMFDHFSGGEVHSDGDGINFSDAVFYAQIEPFNLEDYHNRREMLLNIPDWKPQKGDIFSMVISDDVVRWVEVVGAVGQSIHSNHGDKYVLNVRDRLEHLEPFISVEQTIKPSYQEYPRLYTDIAYTDAPFFDVVEADEDTDRDVIYRKFKMVYMGEESVQKYAEVADLVRQKTDIGINYYFDVDDGVTVDKLLVEKFKFTADAPVKTYDVMGSKFTKSLFIIDDEILIKQINKDLTDVNAVKLISSESDDQYLSQLQYDQKSKTFRFIVDVKIGAVNTYDLEFSNTEKIRFVIDASELESAN